MGYRPNNAWLAFEKHAGPLFRRGMSVLEMAPGNHRRSLVRKFVQPLGCVYHFADILNRHANKSGFVRMLDEFTIDSPSHRFDVAVAYCCLHNIRCVWRWVPEVARVVKSGGLWMSVSNVTEDVNRHPVDCGRIFPDGMRCLLVESGLVPKVLEYEGLWRDEPACRRHQIGNAQVVDLVAIARKP